MDGGDEIGPVDAIGPRIRGLRRDRGRTLTEVAAAAGLSIGHLSQVERGLSTPTIRQMQAIAAALGERIAWFFREPDGVGRSSAEGPLTVRAGRHRTLRYDGLGMTDFLLSPHLEGALEMLLCVLEPGASSGDDPYSHEGEEAGVIVEGRLELWVGDERFLLDAGDSFAFPSNRPHRYRNPGDVTTRIVWAVTPPSY